MGDTINSDEPSRLFCIPGMSFSPSFLQDKILHPWELFIRVAYPEVDEQGRKNQLTTKKERISILSFDWVD
jgi:hypothetical protein